MRTFHRQRATARAIATFGVTALVIGACGSEEDYANEERPPTPIVVSAAISEDGISVSPKAFGAGPVTLIVTNQTDSAQEVTLETDEIGGNATGIQQESGPINPGDTASLKAELEQGTYRVGVDGAGIEPSALEVGKPRPSAQDQLLQP